MAPNQSTRAEKTNMIDLAAVQILANMMEKASATRQLISAWGQMQAYLVTTKLAWFSKALPEFVGVDKANRIM